MSRPKTPQINIPAAPKLPTASELFQQSLAFNQENFPLATGAREGALGDISTPESTTAFFEGFQPTSLEEALAHEQFKQLFPEGEAGTFERSTNQLLSQRGLQGTAIGPELIGRAEQDAQIQVGEFLRGLAEQRAVGNLNARLGINPINDLGPQAQLGGQQSRQQGNFDFQTGLAKAEAEFQNALNEFNRKQAFSKTIGTIGGLAGGALFGPFGAAAGGALGGGLSGGGLEGALGGGLGGATQGGLFGGPVGSSQRQSVGQAQPVFPISQGNVAGTGLFGSKFGGQTQSEILGGNTSRFI